MRWVHIGRVQRRYGGHSHEAVLAARNLPRRSLRVGSGSQQRRVSPSRPWATLVVGGARTMRPCRRWEGRLLTAATCLGAQPTAAQVKLCSVARSDSWHHPSFKARSARALLTAGSRKLQLRLTCFSPVKRNDAPACPTSPLTREFCAVKLRLT